MEKMCYMPIWDHYSQHSRILMHRRINEVGPGRGYMHLPIRAKSFFSCLFCVRCVVHCYAVVLYQWKIPNNDIVLFTEHTVSASDMCIVRSAYGCLSVGLLFSVYSVCLNDNGLLIPLVHVNVCASACTLLTTPEQQKQQTRKNERDYIHIDIMTITVSCCFLLTTPTLNRTGSINNEPTEFTL